MLCIILVRVEIIHIAYPRIQIIQQIDGYDVPKDIISYSLFISINAMEGSMVVIWLSRTVEFGKQP